VHEDLRRPYPRLGNRVLTVTVMRVWIDQDLCVGNGICEELAPEVFQIVDGAIAYVRDGDKLLPRGQDGIAIVPGELEATVVDAAEECPASCIYIEP
jgi:ferredoxin